MTGRSELLIVDDDVDIVEELQEFLEAEGYRCHGATTAVDARRQFAQAPRVGVVMVDLRMPDQDGLSLLHDLKRDAKNRPFESIVFTGYGGEEDVIAALRLGVFDYQKKPVDIDALRESVRRAEQRLKEQQRARTMESELSRRLDMLSESLAGFSAELGELRSRVGAGRPLAAPRLDRGMDSNNGNGSAAAPPPIWSNLTARQWDVLQCIGRGCNNYQIACELGISENTVKLHVSHILKVTGMTNRTQLALALTRETMNMRDASG